MMNGRVLENLRDTYIVSPSYATLYSTRRNTQPKEIFVSLCKLQIPTKVGFFVWRNFWNRLPTKDMLRDKNVQLNNENNLCPFCYKVEESPSKKKKEESCSLPVKRWFYYEMNFINIALGFVVRIRRSR